jgi:hypothetical protein
MKASALLIAISIVGCVAFAIIGVVRNLTPLENVLLQVFAIGVGVASSIVFGRLSARSAAQEMIKPHARSAFRRLVSLYRSLSRVATAIEIARPHLQQSAIGLATLDKLSAIVTEQLSTAGDALEDWNDIVPEEVSELRERMREAQTHDGSGRQ